LNPKAAENVYTSHDQRRDAGESECARMNYSTEAETCRREALQHLGKPEASFLLRVARAFDELDRDAGNASKRHSQNALGTGSSADR
jgi:hypothetical protein